MGHKGINTHIRLSKLNLMKRKHRGSKPKYSVSVKMEPRMNCNIEQVGTHADGHALYDLLLTPARPHIVLATDLLFVAFVGVFRVIRVAECVGQIEIVLLFLGLKIA